MSGFIRSRSNNKHFAKHHLEKNMKAGCREEYSVIYDVKLKGSYWTIGKHTNVEVMTPFHKEKDNHKAAQDKLVKELEATGLYDKVRIASVTYI